MKLFVFIIIVKLIKYIKGWFNFFIIGGLCSLFFIVEVWVLVLYKICVLSNVIVGWKVLIIFFLCFL